jgi:Fanconi anemia group M protein
VRQYSLGDFDPKLKRKPPPDGKHKDCFEVKDDVIVHPLLAEGAIQRRSYQLNIAVQALEASTLVVLPTGLGKTIIAAFAAVEVLQHDMGKVVFLAPTKPLAQQHKDHFSRIISGLLSMQLFTGTMPAAKRKKLWASTSMVFATPQGIANDIENGRYSLKDVGLIIFDEAHRAVGDYAYVSIAAKYREQRELDGREALVLGLTASPGSDRAKIEEVLDNLGISNVEARTEDDPDILPYVQRTDVIWKKVKLSTYMVRARRAFEEAFMKEVNKLKRKGFVRHRRKGQKASKKDIIGAGNMIRAQLGKATKKTKGRLFGALHNQTISLHMAHCLELLETQGVEPTLLYIDRMRAEEKPKKSMKAFLKNKDVIRAYDHLTRHRGVSHPKVTELLGIVKLRLEKEPDSLIIIFTQFRDTIAGLIKDLQENGYSTQRFVGQAHKRGDAGLSQKEQAAILDRFRKREFNILVASSVAEEGLDIPAVDLVIFYEPVPSAIRAIQRRGRTGRSDVGKVIVLITQDSRDEGFLFAELGREKKMKGIVKRMTLRRKVKKKD